MPISTFKHVVVSADTRTTEFFMAVMSAVWSTWVLYTNHTAHTNFTDIMHKTGGPMLWGIWPATNCLFQAFAIYYKYPKFRCLAACLCAVYWVTITYITFSLNPAMFTPWMGLVFVMIQAWVVAHRNAAPNAA